MSAKDDLNQALNFAYFYLKFRARTKKEIEKYLLKKGENLGWTTQTIEDALKILEEKKYIDDPAFINWFVSSRNSRKQKSQYVLKGELIRLGVEKQLIDEYFSENTQDETEMALNALQTRWRKISDLPKIDRFKKSASFLQSRGFSWETIKKVVDKLEETE